MLSKPFPISISGMARTLTVEQRIERYLSQSGGIKSVTTDGTRTEEHSRRDQRDDLYFAATNQAFKNGFLGIRMTRMPGSTARGEC